MKTVTLQQGERLLKIVEEMPVEVLQALFERGYISDLFSADVGQMNRHDFRKSCGLSPILMSFSCISKPEPHGASYDWTLETDFPGQDGNFKPKLVHILKEGETWITGEEMLKRARLSGDCLCQSYAYAMLRKYWEIPKEWQNLRLIFPNTIWADPKGKKYVPGIDCIDGIWYMHFEDVEAGYNQNSRLVHGIRA